MNLEELEKVARAATQGKWEAFDAEYNGDNVCVQHCPDSQMNVPELLMVAELAI